jgi:hypothetical protein
MTMPVHSHPAHHTHTNTKHLPRKSQSLEKPFLEPLEKMEKPGPEAGKISILWWTICHHFNLECGMLI